MLLLAATAAVLPAAHAWTDCATGSTVFKVSDVTLDPQPVKPGDTAQFVIKAESSEPVVLQGVCFAAGKVVWGRWVQVWLIRERFEQLCEVTESAPDGFGELWTR